jgi:flagellar hook-associated protein 3 FlgL
MIRVSTNMIFDQGVFNMQNRTATLLKTQDQLSTGRRILTPADDPIGSAHSLEIEQSKAINEQYQRNSDSATAALGLSENALSSVTSLLQDVKTQAVNAGNGALSQTELKSIGNDLRARYRELIGLANSTDGNGQYLYSGFQGSTRPFTETAPGVVAYLGDQGTRLTQITASRQLAVSDEGSDIFQKIKNGNGTFATAAAGANAGTGIISPGEVLDVAAWNGAGNPQDFSINFFVDNTQNPPVTTYDIVDNVSGNSLLTGAPAGAGPYLRTYTENATISLKTQAPPDTNPVPFDYGVQFSIKGQPATGDTFSLQASTNVDVFTTLYSLITAVESAQDSAAGNTKLANQINTALSDIDRSLDNVLRVHASVGNRLAEIGSAKSASQDLVVQYQKTLSDARDLDYAKAISDLTQQQLTLQAAQQSFARVQGLTLFNFI